MYYITVVFDVACCVVVMSMYRVVSGTVVEFCPERATRTCHLFEEQPIRIRFVLVVGSLVMLTSSRVATVHTRRCLSQSLAPLAEVQCALYRADSGWDGTKSVHSMGENTPVPGCQGVRCGSERYSVRVPKRQGDQ
jgi:hypothetical protein